MGVRSPGRTAQRSGLECSQWPALPRTLRSAPSWSRPDPLSPGRQATAPSPALGIARGSEQQESHSESGPHALAPEMAW